MEKISFFLGKFDLFSSPGCHLQLTQFLLCIIMGKKTKHHRTIGTLQIRQLYHDNARRTSIETTLIGQGECENIISPSLFVLSTTWSSRYIPN